MEYNPYRALKVLGYDPEDPKALEVYKELIKKGELRSPDNNLGVTEESIYAYLRRQREVKQKQVAEIEDSLKELLEKIDNLTVMVEKLQAKAGQEEKVKEVKY